MDNRMLTAEGLKNLFWGEIIAICAALWFFLFARRRREDEQEQNKTTL